MTNPETVAALISFASAVAGAIASFAAFRSARSAALAQDALLDFEERGRRREAASLVAQIYLEHERTVFAGKTLRTLYRGNASVSGGYTELRHQRLQETLDGELASAKELANVITPFSGQSCSLSDTPREDLDRIIINLTLTLAKLRGLLERLIRESQSQEAQLLQSREASLPRNRHDV